MFNKDYPRSQPAEVVDIAITKSRGRADRMAGVALPKDECSCHSQGKL